MLIFYFYLLSLFFQIYDFNKALKIQLNCIFCWKMNSGIKTSRDLWMSVLEKIMWFFLIFHFCSSLVLRRYNLRYAFCTVWSFAAILKPWISQIMWPNSCKSSCKITFLFYKIFSCKFRKYNRSWKCGNLNIPEKSQGPFRHLWDNFASFKLPMWEP